MLSSKKKKKERNLVYLFTFLFHVDDIVEQRQKSQQSYFRCHILVA